MILHPRQHNVTEDFTFSNTAVRTPSLIQKIIPNCIIYRIWCNHKVTSAPPSVLSIQANCWNTTTDPFCMSCIRACKTCNLFVYGTISLSNHTEPNGLKKRGLHTVCYRVNKTHNYTIQPDKFGQCILKWWNWMARNVTLSWHRSQRQSWITCRHPEKGQTILLMVHHIRKNVM